MKEKENGRRSFLKDVLSGSLAASLAACQTAFNQERNDRVKRGEMFYRPLGRTNLLISEVSLGGARGRSGGFLKRSDEIKFTWARSFT